MKNLFLILLLLNVTTLFSQTNHFNGTWTKIDTTYEFDFELVLNEKGSNRVEGYFTWKVVRYDENSTFSKQYYEKKMGRTGKEYVKGTYNHAEGVYKLKGYKKHDPHAIIGLDTYNLKLDDNGEIGGTTNANGTWLGRIWGSKVKIDLL